MGFLSKVFKPVSALFGALFKPITKLLQDWLQPDLPEKEGLKLQRVGSNKPIPVVYGTRIVGGIIVDKNVTDGAIDFSFFGTDIVIKNGNKNGLLHLLVVFCYGEVDAIEEIYFNGTPSSDEQFKDDGEPMFKIETRLGGSDNNTAVSGTDKFNKFNSDTSKYQGLCYALITLEQDKDQSFWRGEPEITAKIRGKKCYDWRSDTVMYTENPAVHMVDYVKSGVYGISLSDTDINYPYFTQVADQCDIDEEGNTVTTATGYYDYQNRQWIETGEIVTTQTFKRFTNNTIIDTDKELFENMKELAQPFRGFFPEPDGRLAIASEDSASPVFAFDGDNIVSTITRTQAAANERYNKVIVRFPNKLNKYEFDEVYYPDESDPIYNQWVEEDNFLTLENTIEVEHCVYKAEALQLAEVAAKASRNSEQVQFTATFEAIELDVGDVVTISDETRGWIDREYRVVALEYRDDALVDITAILHNNTIYPWVTKDYQERVGGVFLGDPYNPSAPFNLVLTADPTLTTTGTLTWSHEGDAFVRNYRVVINRAGDDEPVLDINTQSRSYVVPTLDAGTYEIDVYAVTTLGIQSDEASLALELTSPVAPDDMSFVIGDWTIEVQPIISSGGVGFGTTFEFDYVFGDGATHTPQPRFDGASLVATGLIPLSQYTFFARSVNAYGASDWYSESATTTNTGDQTAAQLDPIRDELDSINLLLDDLPEEIGDFSVISGKVDDLEVDVAEINTEIDATQVQIENIQDELGNDIHAYVTEITELHNDYLNRKATRATATRVDSLEGDVVATTLLLNQSGLDEFGNTTALIALRGEVDNANTGLAATFTIAGQAKNTADDAQSSIVTINTRLDDAEGNILANAGLISQVETDVTGNTSAINALTTTVNDPVTGLSATNTLAQSAESKADGNITSINLLEARVDGAESDISANASLIQSVEVTANNADSQSSSNATAITALTTRVDDAESNISAVNTIAQQAQQDANDNASAITSISSRVTDNEDFAAAQLSLNATYEGDIDSLSARAFLGTNVNNRVTGITIADSGSQQQIIFQSDAVAFTDNAGTLMIYYDTVNGRYVFDGEIIADAGTFSGTVSSAEIVSSNITGTTVTGGKVQTATSGSRVIMEDDGTYMLWVGSGTKNDTNATFFIKKDGTVYSDGSIFSGQIVETNFVTGTLSASVTHNSAGKDVEISVTSNGSVTVIASNAPSPVGVTTYTETLTIKRGSTTLSTQPVTVTRVVEYEAAEGEYTTRDFYSYSDTIVDTGTSSAAYTYSATITDMPLSASVQKITLKTTENILSS